MRQIDNNFFVKSEAEKKASIDALLEMNETVLWKCKPKKGVYAVEKAFKESPFGFIFPLILLIVAIIIISGDETVLSSPEFWFIPIIFGALAIIPFIYFIISLCVAIKEMRFTEYCVSDKRILCKYGKYGYINVSIPLSEVSGVKLKKGLIDKMLKAGDIYVTGDHGCIVFFDVPDCEFILRKITDLSSGLYGKEKIPKMFYEDNCICEHCGSYYSAKSNKCLSCGAPRTQKTKIAKAKRH